MDKIISNEIINGNISIRKKNKLKSPHRLSKKYSELLEKKNKSNKKNRKNKNNYVKNDGKNKKITIKTELGTPIFIKTNNQKKKKFKKSSLKNNIRHSNAAKNIANKKLETKPKPSTKQVETKPKPYAKQVETKPKPKPYAKQVETKPTPSTKQVETKPKLKQVNKSLSKKQRRFSKKKLHKKHTKSRKISFTCYPQNNKNVNDIIKKTEKMTNEQIKKELFNEGIEIKSDKQKLLKDIYMFTSMGGIKINKE